MSDGPDTTRVCPSCGQERDASLATCPRDGTWLGKGDEDKWLGEVLEDRYRIEHVLGRGGAGVVFMAKHLRLGSDVAIKIVDVQGRDPTAVKRLEREARAVALVGHENIVNVLDFGRTADGSAFLAMQLLVGETVDQRLSRGPLDLATTCTIIVQIAHALEAAHECGVVHRDIKPGNVFLCRERGRADFVKVLDFGIAALMTPLESEIPPDRRPNSGTLVFGTPEYIAPERLSQERRVDSRADVYSVGVMMYEMLCGETPFRGANPVDVVLRALEDRHVPLSQRVPDLPRSDLVDDLIAHLLAKNPEDRLPTMRALRVRIVDLRNELQLPSRRRAEMVEDPRRYRRPLSGWVKTVGKTTLVELAGVLDERSELASISERIVGPEVGIKVAQITRINSGGFQRWVEWVRGLLARDFRLSFHECSPAVIRQASLTQAFLQGVPVVSFQAPYYCPSCGFERVQLVRTAALIRGLPFPPCDVCTTAMILDEVEETYLFFLRRSIDEG